MADTETLERVCAAQRSRVRAAVAVAQPSQAVMSCGTSSSGIGRHRAWLRTDHSGAPAATYVPAEDMHLRHRSRRVRSRKAPSALRHLLCCMRPDGGDPRRDVAPTSAQLLRASTTTHDTQQSTDACVTRVYTPHTQRSTASLEPPLPPLAQTTGSSALTHADHGTAVVAQGCVYLDADPLSWLEQVISGISPGVALKLMHAAFQPASSFRELQPLLEGKPPHLQALAMQACIPCIDTRHEFDATIRNAREARCAADILPHLPTLAAVKLSLSTDRPASFPSDATLERLMHAACSPAHLKTLHLSFANHSLSPDLARDLTSALSRGSELESFQFAAGGIADLRAAADLARQVCALTRLTRLELAGQGLVSPMAVTLAACMTNLTALRELHLDDGTMPYAHTAAVTRAAAALPGLTSMYFGGVSSARHSSGVGATADQEQSARLMVSAVCTAPQLRALSIYEGNPISSSWCRLGRAMEAHAVGYAQLTSLSLVRSVRCEDMLGLGRALACMPLLETLSLVLAGHAHGVPDRGATGDACDVALPRLLRGISTVTRLSTLVLAGVDVPEGSADAFVRAVTRLPLQKLVLSDAAPSGHTWAPAAGALAAAMASGTRLIALRDLYLLSWRVDGDAASTLAAAVGGLPGLTSLNFAVTDSGKADLAVLSTGLQCMTALQQLYLRAAAVSKAGLCALAPALQELTSLKELRLQYEGIGADMLWDLMLALVVPRDRSPLGEVAQERGYRNACGLRPAHRGGCGPGMLHLEVLDVGRCKLEGEAALDPELLRSVVCSLPRLQKVRVGSLLGGDLSAFSDWPVKVSGRV